MPMDLVTALGELGKISKASTPVVSVYLDTRWADEHQRDRVRVFLKNELARARRALSNRAAEREPRALSALRQADTPGGPGRDPGP